MPCLHPYHHSNYCGEEPLCELNPPQVSHRSHNTPTPWFVFLSVSRTGLPQHISAPGCQTSVDSRVCRYCRWRREGRRGGRRQEGDWFLIISSSIAALKTINTSETISYIPIEREDDKDRKNRQHAVWQNWPQYGLWLLQRRRPSQLWSLPGALQLLRDLAHLIH